MAEAQKAAEARWRFYEQLAAMHYGEGSTVASTSGHEQEGEAE